MVTREDVESFLMRMELDFEEVDDGMWVVHMGENGAGLVVNHSPPVLVFRAKVLDVPKDQKACAELFQRLLELNASDMVHGAYAIEEGDIIVTEAMELENLDFSEFQATIDSIQMAMSAHVEEIGAYRDC
jgi:hypothetical protein